MIFALFALFALLFFPSPSSSSNLHRIYSQFTARTRGTLSLYSSSSLACHEPLCRYSRNSSLLRKQLTSIPTMSNLRPRHLEVTAWFRRARSSTGKRGKLFSLLLSFPPLSLLPSAFNLTRSSQKLCRVKQNLPPQPIRQARSRTLGFKKRFSSCSKSGRTKESSITRRSTALAGRHRIGRMI